MQLLIRLLALAGLLSHTLADNTTSHNQLLSRQTADCFPIFLEYPSASFVQCGSLYISNLCACCPGAALGCYISLDVCSSDSYGNSICCPQDNLNCGIEAVSPATSAPPSPAPTTTQVYESSPPTTSQEYTSAAATTVIPTTPTTTQYYSSATTSASQSDTNTDFNPGGGPSTGTTTSAPSAPTSSFLTGGAGGPSPSLCGGWEIFAMLFVFHFI